MSKGFGNGGFGDERGNGGMGMGGGGYLLGPGGIPMMVVDRGREQSQQPSRQHADKPPARVMLALRALEFFKEVTADYPVVFPVASHGESQAADVKIMKGQTLTADEFGAQDAAARCLTQYFSGTLKSNEWENADLHTAPTAQTTCICVIQTSEGKLVAAPNCPICGGEGKMNIVLDASKIRQMCCEATSKEIVREPVSKRKNS